MTNKIVEILMERDSMSEDEAWEYIRDVAEGIDDTSYMELDDLLHDEFGLEPDYVMDLYDAIKENPLCQ